jgi:hypothetical protein
MTRKVVNFMHRSKYHQWFIGSVFLYIAMLFLYANFVVFAPGNFLVSFTKAEAVNTEIGQDVNFRLCRDSRIGAVKVTGVRTFYVDTTENPVKEVPVSFTIESSGCINALISAKSQPQRPGTYIVRTDLEFQYTYMQKKTSYVLYYHYGS